MTPREQALSDAELVELNFSPGKANAVDPGEIDKPAVQPPTATCSDFNSMMNVLTDYCQWQDCMTADHLNLLGMLQANVADAAAPNVKLTPLDFLVVPKLC